MHVPPSISLRALCSAPYPKNFLGEFGKQWSDVCVWYPEGLQAFVDVRKISPFANFVVHDNERVSGIPHRKPSRM